MFVGERQTPAERVSDTPHRSSVFGCRVAQPAYVLLPVRRIDCERCTSTYRRPPADEADRCDLCGTRGIETFWPLRVAVAYWIVLGDTCQPCARELGNPAASMTTEEPPA